MANAVPPFFITQRLLKKVLSINGDKAGIPTYCYRKNLPARSAFRLRSYLPHSDLKDLTAP